MKPPTNSTEIPFCPRCGGQQFTRDSVKMWLCGQCQFTYFHNTASAVAAVLKVEDEILLAVRKNDPGAGLLDLPGGFVDYDESLEQALTREIQEELNLDISTWRYLFSYGNHYEYKSVTYYTTDSYFQSDFTEKPQVIAADDVASAIWMKIHDIELDQFAFHATRNAIRRLQSISHMRSGSE